MNEPRMPVAGVDYPATYRQFTEWFADEQGCRAFLARCRWPDGFVCPGCGSRAQPWTTARGYLHCRACAAEQSVTAGTIFEGTRLPLSTWYAAMWLVTSQKDGASALGLQRVLGLRSYQTAWTWLHKLRRAMVRPGRDRLRGRIEVDETLVGSNQEHKTRGRGGSQEVVLIAVEVPTAKRLGRVRLRRVPDGAGDSLIPFIQAVAEPGAEILTDGWRGYSGVAAAGYQHTATNIKATGNPAHVSMPGVHRVASLLKRWLMSTHQGAACGKHLDYYLDEYTFRFNRRNARSRGLLFYRLLEQAAVTPPSSYREIVGNHPNL